MNCFVALDILNQLKETYVSRNGLMDSENTYPALVCGINALEKLDMLKKWIDGEIEKESFRIEGLEMLNREEDFYVLQTIRIVENKWKEVRDLI